MESLKIQIRKPDFFSFGECLWYLDRGFDDCLHEIRDGKLRKLLCLSGQQVLLEISETAKYIVAEVLAGSSPDPQEVEAYIRNWFDLDRDLQAFDVLLRQDADFQFMSDRYRGLRLVGIPDLFEALCWAVIGQQINLTFAYKLKRRLVETCGASLVYAGKRYYAFPEPHAVRLLDPEDLKVFQFSAKKAEYLVGIAALFQKGDLSAGQLEKLPDHAQRLQTLVAVRGIGEWTAEYALMKSFKAMRSIPYGDAGLNNALFRLKDIPKKENRAAVTAVFEPFAGWEAYLVFYLWRFLSEGA